MPDTASLKAILEQRHPVYVRCAPEWQFYRDHYEGGPRYPAAQNPLPLMSQQASIARGVHNGAAPEKYYGSTHYLWQYPLEKTDKYLHRMNRAVYVNIVAPVVDFYCSTVGKQENILIDVDEQFQAFLDDIDRQGQSFHQFMADVRTSATVRGMTFLFVDSPSVAVQPRTQREAIEMGLRPYVVQIKPEDLLNWRLDEFGRPLEILYRVKTEVPGSLTEVRDQNCGWVYRHWTRDNWTSYIQETAEGDIHAGPSGPNPLGVIPIVPVYHHRTKAWEAQSLLKDSAKIGQLVTNWCSSLDEGFETTMFAIPVIKSRKTPSEVGAGSAVVMHLNPEDGEEFYYVTPETQPFEAGWDAFYRMIQLANKHMGIAPKAITTDTLDTQSGVSKQWDFFEAEKILSAMATNEQEAAKLVLQYAGMWMGTEFAGSIQYATKYDLATVAEDIADMLSLQMAGAPLTARKEIMRRIVAKKLPSLDEKTAKKIDGEIEKMSDVSAAAGLAAPGGGGAPPSKPAPKSEEKEA